MKHHRHLQSVKDLPPAVGPRDICLEQSRRVCVAPKDEGDAIGQKTVRFFRDKQTRRMRVDQRPLNFEAVFAVKGRLIHEGSDCWLGVRGRPWCSGRAHVRDCDYVRAIGDGNGGRVCGNDFVLTVNLQDEAVRGDVDEFTGPGTVSAGV